LKKEGKLPEKRKNSSQKTDTLIKQNVPSTPTPTTTTTTTTTTQTITITTSG